MPSVLARPEGHSLECGKTQLIHKMEQKLKIVESNSLTKIWNLGEAFNVCLIKKVKYQNSCDLTSIFPMVSVEAKARDRQQGSEDGDTDKDEVDPFLTSAEHCLTAMETGIKITHGLSKVEDALRQTFRTAANQWHIHLLF